MFPHPTAILLRTQCLCFFIPPEMQTLNIGLNCPHARGASC